MYLIITIVGKVSLHTIPPRERGGNMDIRYLKEGMSIYLPSFIDGSGLTIGDLHYAQGDGEVSGMAIEMSADVWASTEIPKNGHDLSRGPHYEGSSQLLDIRISQLVDAPNVGVTALLPLDIFIGQQQ